MLKTLLKKPSAYLPLLISVFILVMMVFEGYRTGFVRQEDEGVAAHLFQILMPAQGLIILYFAFKYLSRYPKQAGIILILQILLALVVCAPVFFLKL